MVPATGAAQSVPTHDATPTSVAKPPGAAAAAPASDAVAIALRVPVVRTAELRARTLSETLERTLLQQELDQPSNTEQVTQYYHQFVDRFVAPEAIDVWRLLVGTEAQAKALLAQLEASKTPQKTWSQLCREHSLDKATHFRKGSLGFVRANGTTDVPQVRVSPAIFAAAKLLKDGSFSPSPIKEGDNWALIWRRAFRPEARTSIEQARPEIEQQLALSRARAGLERLLGELRAAHLQEYHPELVESIPFPTDEGLPVPRRQRRPHPADRSPTPRKTDWGER